MGVNLKESPLGRKIKEALDKICAGNEGHAELDELNIDTDNGIASGKARLKHQHDFGGAQLGPNTMNMTFKFDYTTGEYDGDIELDNVKLKEPVFGNTIIDESITVDVGTIKKIMEGELTAVFELIPNPGGVVQREIKSDYKSIRQSYLDKHGGEGNVYFASERFVRWASLGTAGKWVLEAIASGGAAAFATAMKEAAIEAKKELKLLKKWFEDKAQAEAESVALKILTGEKVDWPFIAVKWQTVKYASVIRIGGRQVGGEVLPNRHAAFVFIWTGQGGSQADPTPSGLDNKPIEPVENPDDDPRENPPLGNPTQTLPLPNDQGSINTTTNFQVTIKNGTGHPVRAKTVRFSNLEPQVFSIDLQANETGQAITFLGGSTRGAGAWSLPGGKLTTRTAVPLYQSLQVTVTDSAGLPDPDDVGLANTQSQFSVRFRNDTQRKVRMKTVRISNQNPTVFSVDLAPGHSSPVAVFFGGSTRLFAVWTVPDGKLVLLKPLPIYKSQCVVYREFIEMTGDGTVVHVPLLGFEPLDG